MGEIRITHSELYGPNPPNTLLAEKMKKKQIILSATLLVGGISIGAAGGFMFAMHMFRETWGFMQRGQLVELEEVALDAYRSADPGHAERTLLRVATNLQDMIEMALDTEIPGKSDLHFDLVLTYGRLGHLLESQGKTNKAQSYYNRALENWNSMDHGEIDRPLTLDRLKTIITTMDKSDEDSQQPDGAVTQESARSAAP